MPASKNSKISRRSRSDSGGFTATALCLLASAAVMAAAIAYFQLTGSTLYYGDAEAHLDIARRIVDSRTAGWSQVGTTWLPLPHLMMLPFVRNDRLWMTGLAGAIPSGICATLAACFLFAATRRLFDSKLAASVAASAFLLNPNTLYLGSIPMTEPLFFACLFGLLYFTVRFGQTEGWGALIGAAVAAMAGTLTRYEAWFLLPFAAAFIWVTGRSRRWITTAIFCVIAGSGPLLWLLHNRYYYGDPLYFYRGPYSALAIQGNATYPGKGNWTMAAQYFLEAGKLVAGFPALLVGAAGILAALGRRVVWPVLLLILPPAFYVWSIHSSGVPLFIPTLWPHSFYNTRYATAFLPLIAIGAAALTSSAARFAKPVAIAVLLAVFAPLALHPTERAITWQESDVNSRTRRQWIGLAVDFLRAEAGPDAKYFTGFGELTPIFRTLGVPLRHTLTGDNEAEWAGAVMRPDLFLHEDWAVVRGGDEAQTVIDKARLHGPRYELRRRITVKGAPVVEIYERLHENPIR